MYGNPYYCPYGSTKDQLEHYGVLGMKWGVRKDANKAYAKASKKLGKLDTKILKARKKQARAEQVSAKKEKSAALKLAYADTKRKQVNAQKAARKAAKAKLKEIKTTKKAEKRLKKAITWYEKMDAVFKNTTLTNVSEADAALGERYLEMAFQYRRTRT